MSDAGGGADGSGDASESTPTIRELDDRTVRQIAAGEVVERPASVVKELVENSLDAGADRISVAVEAGGTDGIRVRDDGVGMDRASVERAVEEHTTSKIDTIEDLEAGVGTLGFRGEALHTIGAVSRLTIRTKPRGGDSGTELRVEGGEVTEVGAAGCPEGTVVAVEDLFYNTPARRKFLKTTATEFDHVNTVVTHYALANPDVAISLEHDDREVFATEGRGDLRSAVLSVYGREVAEAMIRVEYEGENAAGDRGTDAPPVESVTGLVSHPETTRSTREYLSTFVNGRYVAAGVLREAVLDAYGGQVAPDRYPFAVLFVDLPADAVDVNVHPRKMEVRFDDEAGVKQAVTEAVREALLEEGLIRSTAPRGRSAPDETEIDPESPESEVRGGAGHDGSASGGGRSPRADADVGTDAGGGIGGDPAVDPEDTPGDDDDGTAAPGTEHSDAATSADSVEGVDSPSDGDDARTVDPESDDAWTVSRGSTGASRAPDDNSRQDRSGGDRVELGGRSHAHTDESISNIDAEPGSSNADAEPGSGAGSAPAASSPRDQPSETPTGVVGPTVQRDLTGDAASLEPDFESLPSMRVLGQLHDTYVVAETDSGLLLIDQHAADERVNYERLQTELDGDVATQALAEPVALELTAREAALFSEYQAALTELGFRTERVDDRTVEVRSVPAVFAAALDPELLRDVLSAFVSEGDGDAGGESAVASVADELLADLACYPSVTGNTSLTEGSVVDLLEALDDCENPYACPHGRPVVVSVDTDEIESRFERDYPGHGGRRGE